MSSGQRGGMRQESRRRGRRRPNATTTRQKVEESLLFVQDLKVGIRTDDAEFVAVDGVSFTVPRERIVGIVGESGCGKTLTALSVLRLHGSKQVRILGGRIWFEGRNLLDMSESELRHVRGQEVAMVFQDSLAALNPVYTIGDQLVEALQAHAPRLRRKTAWQQAAELLERVRIDRPGERLSAYPHQLSGGMRQRVMIAMALSCGPRLLIADEPTTALDVTVQRQILELLRDLQEQEGMSILMITHDLTLLSEFADDVVVMYAGKVVETAPAHLLYSKPGHPYSQGLLASLGITAEGDHPRRRLATIPGTVPDLRSPPRGCRFEPRCSESIDQCRKDEPRMESVAGRHQAACWLIGDGRAPRPVK